LSSKLAKKPKKLLDKASAGFSNNQTDTQDLFSGASIISGHSSTGNLLVLRSNRGSDTTSFRHRSATRYLCSTNQD